MYNDTRCPLDVIDAAVGPVNEDDIEAAELFNGLFVFKNRFMRYFLF